MKTTVSIDSQESIEMKYSDLANFVNWLNDDKQYAAFFARLAEHPASEVRSAVADKAALPIEIIEKLARDPSVEVVRHVANNEHAMEKFELSLIQEMIDRDVSVASDIADNLSMVRKDATDDIILMLMKHPDPKVVETAQQAEDDGWLYEDRA